MEEGANPMDQYIGRLLDNRYEILESHGVTATVRRTLGSDIDASCGQLRRKFERKGD